MKPRIAIAALVVASIGLATLPAAAQVTTPTASRWDHRHMIRDGAGPHMGMGRAGGGLLGLVCSENGAEALEIAFVRLSHRIDLTADQQPLFDTLKSKALTTQTSFADECKAAMPAAGSEPAPDLVEQLKARLKMEESRLAAMNAILPDLEAFYASLTDEQKAGLMPRMGRNAPMGRNDDRGPGRTDNRLPAPGR